MEFCFHYNHFLIRNVCTTRKPAAVVRPSSKKPGTYKTPGDSKLGSVTNLGVFAQEKNSERQAPLPTVAADGARVDIRTSGEKVLFHPAKATGTVAGRASMSCLAPVVYHRPSNPGNAGTEHVGYSPTSWNIGCTTREAGRTVAAILSGSRPPTRAATLLTRKPLALFDVTIWSSMSIPW